MYPLHWGCLPITKKRKNTDVLVPNKKNQELIITIAEPEEETEPVIIKNSIVTQTIEVMDQSDTITDLIETSKTGFNFVYNPCQMIPKLSIPSETDSNLVNENKFLNFIQPDITSFTSGIPKDFPTLSKKTVNFALRKSICGLLRIKGFSESTEASLILFVEALDEYYKNFMDYTRREIIHEANNLDNTLDIITLEKSYQSLTKHSLLQLHNYFKTEILKKNKTEIAELKNNFQEYDKAMQMSKKTLNIKEEELSKYLEYSDTNVSNMFDGTDNSGMSDMFEQNTNEQGEEHLNISGGPSSSEN